MLQEYALQSIVRKKGDEIFQKLTSRLGIELRFECAPNERSNNLDFDVLVFDQSRVDVFLSPFDMDSNKKYKICNRTLLVFAKP